MFKTVSVLVSGDTAVEFDEGFTVTLANPSSGLSIGTAAAAATIVNDEDRKSAVEGKTVANAEGSSLATANIFTGSLDQAGVVDQKVALGVIGSGGHPANFADLGGVVPGGMV